LQFSAELLLPQFEETGEKMTLIELLVKHKPAILEKWVNLVLETYPPDTASFLKDEPDRFSNPVRYTIASNLTKILDALLDESDTLTLSCGVEEIIKIRAVQDFPASQVISFVWLFKKAVTDELGANISNEHFSEWLGLESRIDALAALSLDVFTACRETIYQLRIQELKAANETAMKIMGQSKLARGN
jgi:hypothetical protein